MKIYTEFMGEVIKVKKFLPIVIAIMICFTGSAFAAGFNNGRIGIIVVGEDEFKTDYFFDKASRIVKKNKKTTVESGEEIQQKYSKYCLENEFDEVEAFQLENFVSNFLVENGFDTVVCINSHVLSMEIGPNPFSDQLIFVETTMRMNIYVITKDSVDRYKIDTFGHYGNEIMQIVKMSIDYKRNAKGDAFSRGIRAARKQIYK